MNYLNIQSVCHLSGINPHTLRAWEARYGAVNPDRSKTGRRLYSFKDLERIRQLKRLVDHGFAIGQIATAPQSVLQEMLFETETSSADMGTSTSANKTQEQGALPGRSEAPRSVTAFPVKEQWVNDLLKHIDQYDLKALHKTLIDARLGMGAIPFVLQVLAPLIKRMGDLVMSNKCNIAQEHALSAIVRGELSRIQVSQPENPNLPKIALASPEGDHHELALLMASVFCTCLGYPTFYFGSNMPVESLVETLNVVNVNYLILSSTPVPAELLPMDINTYIARLGQNLKNNTVVWLGGGKPNQLPGQIQKVRLEPLYTLEELYNHLIDLKAEQNRAS